MNNILSQALTDLIGFGPLYSRIKSPFTIPSGIVTTHPRVIAHMAKTVPQIGFLTTKTLSLEPRPGYREPILHEYHPGCFINAVGLANPGARSFLEEMAPLMPLHDDKPLVVSIMGTDPQEFLECATILEPIADAFELNLSCPHVKGAGQSLGSDPKAVCAVMRLLKSRLKLPIIPKLSPNLGDLPAMARLCEEEGADGLSLINTVGPGTATDEEGTPVLSNVNGGLSGIGVLPIGIKAVREVSAVVSLPVIASGGIASAPDVSAYFRAGARLFAVGSALACMTTPGIGEYFARLEKELQTGSDRGMGRRIFGTGCRTSYSSAKVTENRPIGPDIFLLRLDEGPMCEPGSFVFLRLPGIGEKPFSPASDAPPLFLVRKVGPFTAALADLSPGDRIHIRGPYGKGFPVNTGNDSIVLVGGGTGCAPLLLAVERTAGRVERAFFGFSAPLPAEVVTDFFMERVPNARIAIDPPGEPGEVVRILKADLAADPSVYLRSKVFICGPKAMMAAAAAELADKVPETPVFIAREDMMKCGIGLCGSCGTPNGLRSCVDGPVMSPQS
ncbi:MAG: tRNA-dihydrouridine synthase [Pseudomonadota bacterium]